MLPAASSSMRISAVVFITENLAEGNQDLLRELRSPEAAGDHPDPIPDGVNRARHAHKSGNQSGKLSAWDIFAHDDESHAGHE